jgi:tetratricopeptide (TPR) repeat protein
VPLRLRLNCHSTVALLFEGGRSVERLQELHRIAEQAGFDAQAGICRMHITDELLLRGRFQEAVEAADAMLAAGESLLRVRAVIHLNRTEALVRLGRIAEAQISAQATLRALPAYAHLVMDIFALVAAQQGRLGDAALLAGCSTRLKRERDLHHEPSQQGLVAETHLRLMQALGPQRSAELMAQGAALPVADLLPLVFQAYDEPLT